MNPVVAKRPRSGALLEPVEPELPIGSSHLARLIRHVEQWFGYGIDTIAAALVLTEVVVTFAAVVARFAFNHPLIWSDALATMLFLWLNMVGAAAALLRHEHMRMTTIVQRLPGLWPARFEALALAGAGTFLITLLPAAFTYAQMQADVDIPGLGISGFYTAAAMPAGLALMLAACLLALATRDIRNICFGVGIIGIVAVLLWLTSPVLTNLGNWSLVLFFVVLLAAGVLSGIPIAFTFGLCTVAYLMTTSVTPLAILTGEMSEGMSSIILLAIPLFVLLGYLLVSTHMAEVMVEFLASLIGRVRGGLAYVLIGGVLLVSGISGAKTADLAAVAPVLVPEMKRRGIPEGEIVSLLGTSGAMAETIPPSIVLIIIGSVAGISISALFTGGLLPGCVLAVGLAIVARRRVVATGGAEGARVPPREILRRFAIAVPALILPFIVRFTVMYGVATATEVATIGIVYAVLVGAFVYRRFAWRSLFPMLVRTASLAAAIMFIIGAATSMSWALTQSDFSHAIAHFMVTVPGGRYGFLLITIVVMMVLGSVLEGIPAMVLFGPLLFPAARLLGVPDVQYAMVVILAMGIGLFAPPFGLGYYAACQIADISPDAGMRRIWPYIAALVVGLLLVAAIPWISIGFLPVNK
jgi:tripartite ATP-independent transporter DctM subunit